MSVVDLGLSEVYDGPQEERKADSQGWVRDISQFFPFRFDLKSIKTVPS